jgi:hypothetical protein
MAALRFVEALEEMASNPRLKDELPDGTSETIEYLHRALA